MPSRPKILLVTFGSRGDLHPFVALGQALLKEGCRAVVATSREHRDIILAAGLEFADAFPDGAEVAAGLGLDIDELARRMAADDRFLFEKIVFPHLAESADRLNPICEEIDGIISHSLAFSAQALAEKRGMPLVILILSPALFYTAYDPPKGPGPPFIAEPKSAPALVYNRLALRLMAELAWAWAAPLRRFRRDLGLPPRGGFAFFAPPGAGFDTIALFSPLLAMARPDQDERVLVAGHSFIDDPRAEDADERAALERFLSAGTAPIVFTLGSFVVDMGLSHYRAALAAARALGSRAVLLTRKKDAAALQQESGLNVFIGSYLRHSILFPRASVVAHHGGIGTSGQALKAGRPQLVTPYLGDQHDNASRLKRLGLARTLPGRRTTSAALVRELGALLADPAYAERARAVAAAVAKEDGAAMAARRIKEITSRGG